MLETPVRSPRYALSLMRTTPGGMQVVEPHGPPPSRVITALIGVVMLVSLAACGSDVTGVASASGGATPDAGDPTETSTPQVATTVDAVGTGDPARPLDDPEATGRELARRFLNVLSSPNPTAQLEELLSPAFQLQRSNGTFVNREEYLEQPSSVSRFEILDKNFRAYQDGPVLTVRFNVAITETIDGNEVRVSEANRLGTFVRTDAGWKLAAWSNFNPVVPAS
jgi:hypothetical protein